MPLVKSKLPALPTLKERGLYLGVVFEGHFRILPTTGALFLQLLHGLVYLCWFHCIGFSPLVGEKPSRNKSLSPIGFVPRFCHYCSGVWEKEVTGSFYPLCSSNFLFFYCSLSGKRVSRYNVEISQSIQNPHRL